MRRLLAICFLSLPLSLAAESAPLFQQERLYVDLGIGLGAPYSRMAGGSFGNASYTLALLDAISVDQSRRSLSLLYFATKAGQPVDARTPADFRLFAEFAATSWITFGGGFSYFSTTLSGRGVNQLDRLGDAGYLIMLFSPTSQALAQLGSILYSAPASLSVAALIPEAQFAVHVPAGFADPYFRWSVGSAARLSKVEAGFGSRFAVGEYVYVYGEIFYADYTLLNQHDVYGFNYNRFFNRGVRFGVGYAFDPPDTVR